MHQGTIPSRHYEIAPLIIKAFDHAGSSQTPDSHEREAGTLVSVREISLMTLVAIKACNILLLTISSLIIHSDAAGLIEGATAGRHDEFDEDKP